MGAASGSLGLQGRCSLTQQTNTSRVDHGSGLVRLVVTADIHPFLVDLCATTVNASLSSFVALNPLSGGRGVGRYSCLLESVTISLPVFPHPVELEGVGETNRAPRVGHSGGLYCPHQTWISSLLRYCRLHSPFPRLDYPKWSMA